MEPSGWEWADLLSLDSEGAVRVDSRMQTSQPHIYAAGDLCSADWTHATHWLQVRRSNLFGRSYGNMCMHVFP